MIYLFIYFYREKAELKKRKEKKRGEKKSPTGLLFFLLNFLLNESNKLPLC